MDSTFKAEYKIFNRKIILLRVFSFFTLFLGWPDNIFRQIFPTDLLSSWKYQLDVKFFQPSDGLITVCIDDEYRRSTVGLCLRQQEVAHGTLLQMLYMHLLLLQ
jgi:hypothetical protein